MLRTAHDASAQRHRYSAARTARDGRSSGHPTSAYRQASSSARTVDTRLSDSERATSMEGEFGADMNTCSGSPAAHAHLYSAPQPHARRCAREYGVERPARVTNAPTERFSMCVRNEPCGPSARSGNHDRHDALTCGPRSFSTNGNLPASCTSTPTKSFNDGPFTCSKDGARKQQANNGGRT